MIPKEHVSYHDVYTNIYCMMVSYKYISEKSVKQIDKDGYTTLMTCIKNCEFDKAFEILDDYPICCNIDHMSHHLPTNALMLACKNDKCPEHLADKIFELSNIDNIHVTSKTKRNAFMQCVRRGKYYLAHKISKYNDLFDMSSVDKNGNDWFHFIRNMDNHKKNRHYLDKILDNCTDGFIRTKTLGILHDDSKVFKGLTKDEMLFVAVAHKRIDFKLTDDDGNNIFMLLVDTDGSSEYVNHILSDGPDSKDYWVGEKRIIDRIDNGDWGIVEYFATSHIDECGMNEKDNENMTPLIACSTYKLRSIAMKMLDYPDLCELDHVDDNGDTALTVALRDGYLSDDDSDDDDDDDYGSDIAEKICDNELDIYTYDTVNKDNESPLSLALKRGYAGKVIMIVNKLSSIMNDYDTPPDSIVPLYNKIKKDQRYPSLSPTDHALNVINGLNDEYGKKMYNLFAYCGCDPSYVFNKDRYCRFVWGMKLPGTVDISTLDMDNIDKMKKRIQAYNEMKDDEKECSEMRSCSYCMCDCDEYHLFTSCMHVLPIHNDCRSVMGKGDCFMCGVHSDNIVNVTVA